MGELKVGSIPRLIVPPEPEEDLPATNAAIVPLGPRAPVGASALVPVAPVCATAVLTRDGRVDGAAHCKIVLDQIRSIKRADPARRCVVVFDLDNTVFDTRARTFAVLKAFDESNGTAWFANLELADVGWNGRETCGRCHVPPEVTAAVDAYWETNFWSGDFFGDDLVMRDLYDLAWEAKGAGAEVCYLSGRIEELRDASRGELVAASFPDCDDDHLWLKPAIDVQTGPFKTAKLESLLDEGAFLGWFLTDSRHEIESIRSLETDARPAIPCGHVEHPLQRPGVVSRDTPTFDSSCTEKLISQAQAKKRSRRFTPRQPTV